MSCSPARLHANRRNAAKSTGPKTPEGKARSRQNALKHGLTGEGVALPTEDLAEIDRRFESMQRELNPKGELAEYLVRRVATMTVRVERCVRQETANLSTKVRHAEADYDDLRAAEIESAFRNLADDPSHHCRKLLRSPEGVARMIDAWSGIKEDLGRDEPLFPRNTHILMAENLLGWTQGALSISRVKILVEAMSGNFRFLTNPDAADNDPSGTKARAKSQVFDLIDDEVKQLQTILESFDLDEIDKERAESVDRALFDTSKEATLARKYEAAAERNLYKALNELREVKAEVEANGFEELPEVVESEDVEDIEPTPNRIALGSFFPSTSAPSKPALSGRLEVVGVGSVGSSSTT